MTSFYYYCPECDHQEDRPKREHVVCPWCLKKYGVKNKMKRIA